MFLKNCPFFLLVSSGVLNFIQADVNSYSRCLNSGDPRSHPAMVRFNTPQLIQHDWCEDLSRTECNQYQEATAKCNCLCNELNSSGKERYRPEQNQNPNNNNNNNRPNNWSSWSRPDRPARRRGCFHGDDFVTTNRGRMKIVDLLNVPDAEVLSFNRNSDKLEFSPITYWLHADANKTLDYIIVSTANGPHLHISHKHLIYVSDCRGGGLGRTVFAERVRAGDCLWIKNPDAESAVKGQPMVESKVSEIRTVTKRGLYAPITANGNIVVNEVLASCFTNFENEEIQMHLFSFVLKIRKVFEFVFPNFATTTTAKNSDETQSFMNNVQIPEFVLSFLDMSSYFIQNV